MEILKAILFGIIEGITEWLPISSTGHMILLNEFINLNVSEELKLIEDCGEWLHVQYKNYYYLFYS